MAKLQSLLTAFLAGASIFSVGLAHPGETHSAEEVKKSIAARDLAVAHSKRVTEQCAAKPKHRALRARAAARRSMAAQLLRERRGIVEKPMVSRRDQDALDEWMNTCHDHSEEMGNDLAAAEEVIFTSNATSALTPETIIGPYFVAGEYIRSDISEGQAGVPIHLDIQFIDVATCEPVPDMIVDIWHSNATGVYSGVEGGQGGLDTTFMRGVQVTDEDGVTKFDSIYPGHYMGRTIHIHVASRLGGEILPNGTYTGGTVNHIGQLYFDQELNDAVEETEPYASNTVAVTTNVQDFLTADEATADYDPFLDYIRLGDDPADGLLMWITIGIDTAADYDDMATPAAHYYEDGGEANANGGGFPGGFPDGGPTGGFPGFPTSTTGAGGEATAKPWGPCLKGKEESAEKGE